MEVASPIPFLHGQGGTKRRFAFSPGIDSTAIGVEATQDFSMDDAPTCHQQAFKRRRRLSHETLESAGTALNSNAFPSFAPTASVAFGTPQAKIGGFQTKRNRTDSPEGAGCSLSQSQVQQKIVADLQRLVDHQAAEIDRLKSEKNAMETSFAEVKASNDKSMNENKILKKAVTIQQERQKQAYTELDAARRYKTEAEERIRKLEQMNLTLRYHLQAQQPASMNDFMGFSRRPPDVY